MHDTWNGGRENEAFGWVYLSFYSSQFCLALVKIAVESHIDTLRNPIMCAQDIHSSAAYYGGVCLCVFGEKWYSPEKVSNKLTITMGFSAHIILSLQRGTPVALTCENRRLLNSAQPEPNSLLCSYYSLSLTRAPSILIHSLDYRCPSIRHSCQPFFQLVHTPGNIQSTLYVVLHGSGITWHSNYIDFFCLFSVNCKISIFFGFLLLLMLLLLFRLDGTGCCDTFKCVAIEIQGKVLYTIQWIRSIYKSIYN